MKEKEEPKKTEFRRKSRREKKIWIGKNKEGNLFSIERVNKNQNSIQKI